MRSTSAYGASESDAGFLDRQFHTAVESLERVQALSTGEFMVLANSPARTDDERRQRALHHDDIARRIVIAMHNGLLREEEFNIWSGRRKEWGQPVKYRFERAFANAATPLDVRKRGTLTGIVRAYLRLLDESLERFEAEVAAAHTAAELLAIERRAVREHYLQFECYDTEPVNGWPTYPRSTGRFRGGVHLRKLFEDRQVTLPMRPDEADTLRAEIERGITYESTAATESIARESRLGDYLHRPLKAPASLQRVFDKLANLFARS